MCCSCDERGDCEGEGGEARRDGEIADDALFENISETRLLADVGVTGVRLRHSIFFSLCYYYYMFYFSFAVAVILYSILRKRIDNEDEQKNNLLHEMLRKNSIHILICRKR